MSAFEIFRCFWSISVKSDVNTHVYNNITENLQVFPPVPSLLAPFPDSFASSLILSLPISMPHASLWHCCRSFVDDFKTPRCTVCVSYLWWWFPWCSPLFGEVNLRYEAWEGREPAYIARIGRITWWPWDVSPRWPHLHILFFFFFFNLATHCSRQDEQVLKFNDLL